MKSIEDAKAAILAGTIEKPSDADVAPARFALLIRTTQDPVEKRAEIQAALAPVGAEVRPLSPLETDVLVAIFEARMFLADDAPAFEAGYVLAEAFDVESAEPDLPTNFFPEARPRPTKAPPEEGLDRFPPGCWAPGEPGLEQTPRWVLTKMRVEEAWQFSIERGRPDRGAGIIIAQPDTGVTNHPELQKVDTFSPRDVLDGDPDPTDPLSGGGNPGHGTSTASVVVSREAAVIAGVAPRAIHMPIRAIESVVRITQVTVAEAIEWAVQNGAHVITMSLGGIPSFTLHRALRRAVDADLIVLAAAGNCVRTVVWPARYDDCIAVAGTNSTDEPWRGSCRGSAVDISAPAQNVMVARVIAGNPPQHSVGQAQGTSFAVAETAGVAALWLAHHGRANLIGAARARGETLQAMFRRMVMATARRPANWDVFNMGAGIVDARALLEADLDVGRDRESAPQPNSAAIRSEIALESFLLETAGVEAAMADVDWNRYGPEVVTAMLRRNLEAPASDLGIGAETVAALPAAVVSPQLAAALPAAVAAQLGIGGQQ